MNPLLPLVLILLAVTGVGARAQCTTAWQSPAGTSGLGGPGLATTTWDPDGAGPLPEHIVIGGRFASAGPVAANNIVAYEPITGTWSAIGTGTDDTVLALTVAANGDLVAGGFFGSAGGTACNHVARWNGSQWQPLGAGFDDVVLALAVSNGGQLFAGGHFTTSGGVSINRVAAWNGTSWAPLGSAANNGVDYAVHALHPFGTGIAVGGQFTSASTAGSAKAALWTGSTWSPLGPGLVGTVLAFATSAAGELIAVGQNIIVWPSAPLQWNGVATWNGTTWTSMAEQVHDVQDVVVRPTGEQIFASPYGVLEWDGNTSNVLATGVGSFDAIELLGTGEFCATGWFRTIGQQTPFSHVAMHGPAGWGTLPADSFAASRVDSIARAPNGDLYVGGWVTVGGNSDWIARWDGSSWHGLGSGLNDIVYAIAVLPSGDVVAAGQFTQAGGVAVNGIARWNGNSWHAMPGNTFGAQAFVLLPNGDLLACGFAVERWDGTSWHPYPAGHPPLIFAALQRSNGNLVVGGTSGIAEWDGSTWTSLGSTASGSVMELAETPDGDLIASGQFTSIGGVGVNHIARWNGTAWQAIGFGLNGWGTALAVLPNGDLLAASVSTVFPNDSATLMRWNGVNWSRALGPGAASAVNGYVQTMLPPTDGVVLMGGRFDNAGGVSALRLAKLTTDCPAQSAPAGSGCSGTAGPVALAADNLPWLGSTFRATTTGLTNNSLAVGTFSFRQVSVPLASVHPQGLPGCSVLVDDEILIEFLVGSGEVTSEIAIPNAAPLIGANFYHQVIPVQLTVTGDIAAIAASNALALTAGAF